MKSWTKQLLQLLKIADRFEAKGWRVIDCYRADPLADKEVDEKRLKRAEAQFKKFEKEEKDERERRQERGGFRSEGSSRLSDRRRSRSTSRLRSTSRSSIRSCPMRAVRSMFTRKCWDCQVGGHVRGSTDCKK